MLSKCPDEYDHEYPPLTTEQQFQYLRNCIGSSDFDYTVDEALDVIDDLEKKLQDRREIVKSLKKAQLEHRKLAQKVRRINEYIHRKPPEADNYIRKVYTDKNPPRR